MNKPARFRVPSPQNAITRAAGSPALAWLLTALHCLLIFLQSAFVRPDDLLDIGLPGMDKLVHLLIYLALGTLFARAYTLSLPRILSKRWLFLLAWLSTTLYGASDEFHQAFVGARSADPFDWLADAVGGALGAVLYLRLRGKRRRAP
jgi:VanZ family protein